MEQQIFTLVKDMQWPAVGGLLVWLAIYKIAVPLIPTVSEYIQSKRKFEGKSPSGLSLDDLNANIKLIGSNHLHSLPEMADTLKRIEVSLGKLDDIKTGIEVIKSKIK